MLNENTIKKIEDSLVAYIEDTGLLPWTSAVLRKGDGLEFGRGQGGRPYNGMNAVTTFLDVYIHKFDSWDYLTFNEIKRRGGTLKAGSHAVPIVWWCMGYYVDGERVTYSEYKDALAVGKATFQKGLGLKCYRVFNLAQTDLPYTKYGLEVRGNPASVPAEEIVRGYLDNGGPKLDFYEFGRAEDGCYSPILDEVKVFPRECYGSSSKYYSTLFHELVHSTGHESRLARKSATARDRQGYAREELVAEVGASLLMSQTDLADELASSAAYIKSWSEKIRGKGFVENLTVALKHAVKAADYILDAGAAAATRTA